jgi:iron-sulfur cluster assembly protein
MSGVEMHVRNVEPDIKFTDAATRHILSYLRKQSNSKGLRLSVKKTGCSGLSYVVDYINEPLPDDMVMPFLDDYVVCVEKSSYPYLKGMNVDYVQQGLNFKFIFNNPNQTGACGCGESFTV